MEMKEREEQKVTGVWACGEMAPALTKMKRSGESAGK